MVFRTYRRRLKARSHSSESETSKICSCFFIYLQPTHLSNIANNVFFSRLGFRLVTWFLWAIFCSRFHSRYGWGRLITKLTQITKNISIRFIFLETNHLSPRLVNVIYDNICTGFIFKIRWMSFWKHLPKLIKNQKLDIPYSTTKAFCRVLATHKNTNYKPSKS